MRTKAGLIVVALSLIAVALWLRNAHKQQNANAASIPLYYVDPMHPQYRSSQPGTAPDCGMQLVAVYADDLNKTSASSEAAPDPTVTIGAGSRARYGIKVVSAELGSTTARVHFYGRVAADATRVYQVELGADGYVKETSGDAPGAFVHKNQHLALIYSPEFLSVAGGYLSANERTPGQTVKEQTATSNNASAAQARADRLRNLGMSDVQIEEIGETRKIPEDVYVVAPTDGFILTRSIAAGMRFEKHAEFYRIADLSHVWILAEGLGQNALMLHPGASVEIVNPDTKEHFKARVSDMLPATDPATGALTPRLEAANPGLRLKPGMFVDIFVDPARHTTVTVPAEAIIDTGTAKHVFVELSESQFGVREVTTGQSSGERVEIVHGLQEGERIVASGTFLVDSESRLHASLSPLSDAVQANPSRHRSEHR